MLNSIKYKLTFKSTNKTFQGDYKFEEGLTAITGPNEAGKSLILEMIRYALFGTKALRSSISNYIQLDVELSFKIGDNDYKVVRSKSGTDTLYKGNKPQASGTKPLNTAIENLFGYNLEVFDVSNACLQGQVEALSNKTPAERKRMVDKTIGLDTIDEVIKHVSTKLSDYKSKLEALESTIQSPQEPEKPQRNVSQEEVDKAEAEYKEYVDLKSWLFNARVEEPEEPVDPAPEYSILQLEDIQEAYDSSRRTVSALQKQLDSFNVKEYHPQVNGTFEDREERIRLYKEYKDIQMQYPEPEKTPEWCDEQEQLIKQRHRYEEKVGLEKEISRLEGSPVECPECSHKFELQHSKIDELKEQLKDYEDVQPIEPPKVNEYEIKQYRDMIHNYSCRPDVVEVKKPKDSYDLIAKDKAAKREYDQYIEVLNELMNEKQVKENTRDVSELLNKKREYKTQLAVYERDYEKWLEYSEKKDTIQERVEQLDGIEDKVTALRQDYTATKLYEQAYEKYLADKALMDAREKEIDEIKEQIKKNKNVQIGLKDLKPKVKMYLVPSLNKVSSSLIAQMTQGERNSIVIDEEFNIKVDGQGIEELSGSGQSVANLAIRIGLGTVLTNKVFSVLLADEVDAAMDENRAAHTAECLRNLKKTINQIVIVSHQEPDADHYIELRK